MVYLPLPTYKLNWISRNIDFEVCPKWQGIPLLNLL